MGKRSKSIAAVKQSPEQIKNKIIRKSVNKRKLPAHTNDSVKKSNGINPDQSKTNKISKKNKSKNKNLQNEFTETSSKKIVFLDDDPQEEEETAPVIPSGPNCNKKQFLNPEESDVNDEDIDKFCDEISEVDNVQYEIWVKQVETILHSNKKK